MILLGLLLVPILVSAGFFLICKGTVTWKEFLLQIGVCLLVIVGGYFLAKWGALRDTEHLNGRITAKAEGTQHCCHCHDVCDSRDKKGNCTSSHEVCSHFHDYWWALKTTVGEISIENCSGSSSEPRDWANARVGEPATVDHGYTNYLKADPNSLLVHSAMNQYGVRVPRFPEVYGHYKVNPVIGVGVPVPEGWQEAVREVNADLGALKQVDVTVILTSIQDPTFAQAIESKWLYGPKNSLNIIIGADGDKASWVRVVTFSRVEALKVRLRDDIQGKALAGLDIPNTIHTLIRDQFKRTPMAEFEYLARSATPSTPWLVALYILGLALSIGLGVYMHKNDVFGDESDSGTRSWTKKRGMFYRSY
jgi:hypothetical protein